MVFKVNNNDSRSIFKKLMASTADCSWVRRFGRQAGRAVKNASADYIQSYQRTNVKMTELYEETHLASIIPQALEDGRFHLNFQPIVPATGILKSDMRYELLLRMADEQGHMLAPAAFLPIAERYHLCMLLDRWVLRKVLQWTTCYPEHFARLQLCAINLSGHSLSNDRFLDFVIEQFTRNSLAPSKICFEITEAAAVANIGKATRLIKWLKQLGCYFALDDFGKGWPSFAALKLLPVDFLKIDGSLIHNIVDDYRNLEIVKSINDVGHAMGKKTIAKFVENEAILQKLRVLGVDYVQGYYLGRPQPMTFV